MARRSFSTAESVLCAAKPHTARILLLCLALAALLSLVARPAQGSAADLDGYPWIYLRDGRELGADEKAVELIATGDLNLGRGIAGLEAPLDEVSPWLQQADLTFGNLECVIRDLAPAEYSADSQSQSGPYRLLAAPGAVGDLRSAGFDLLSLANNHSQDAGPAGLAETAGLLKEAGITPLGAGAEGRAYAPTIRRVKGLRLAFLAFNAVHTTPAQAGNASGWSVAGWDPVQAAEAVRQARRGADGVIVSMHWGYEYQTRADPAQAQIARLLLEAGADLILGHHPHVVQNISLQVQPDEPARFVAYSLGNFLFDQEFGDTRQGLALRVFFDRQGLRAVQALPVQSGPRPRLAPAGQAAELMERLLPRRAAGFTCSEESCAPAEPPSAAGSGLFHSGEIDLTGDGRPEAIRLEGERLTIEQNGRTAWESPPEWRVLDAALGDPDGDGRGDLMLAFLKPDSQGVLRSHPFVFGYRYGRYRTLWGGSAVANPILELELGDVDWDGEQELIVLEELRGGQGRAVSVWRWHGWGFSQQWRSAPGDYEDLLFGDGEEGDGPMLRVFERR